MNFVDYLIQLLQQTNTEILTILSTLVSIGFLLGFIAFAREKGIVTYIIISLVTANIQVLKGSNFFFSSAPIPLGTALYGTIGIALSILVENFGNKFARKTINLGFLAMLYFTVLIVFTIGYTPLDPLETSEELFFLYENHEYLSTLFRPIPSIMVASLVAYMTSEYVLVLVQVAMRSISKKFIALRTYFANFLSALVDLFVMNFLAWMLLNPEPIKFDQLIFSYILPNLPFRILTSCIAPFVVKIAEKLLWKGKNEETKKKKAPSRTSSVPRS